MDAQTAQALQTCASIVLTVVAIATLVLWIVYIVGTFKLLKAAQAQTAETANLLKEAQKQNEQTLLPIITLAPATLVREAKWIETQAFHKQTMSIRTLVIRNVGSGPAFNCHTKPITEGHAALLFHHPSALAANEESAIEIELKNHAEAKPLRTIQEFMEVLKTFLDSHFDQENYQTIVLPSQIKLGTRIFYKSAAGNWYETSHSFALDPESHDLIVTLDDFRRLPGPEG